MAVFSKLLTKTDVKKRLAVPTKDKRCFLDFGNRHQVAFEAADENDRVWSFVCSTRKKKEEGQNQIKKKWYPKAVLSSGWLQFVHWWKLEEGDTVELYEIQGKAGKGHYRIKVIKKAGQFPSVLPPPVQDRDGDRTVEATVTSDITDQAMASDQEEGLCDQPVTGRVGLKMVEFTCLKPEFRVGGVSEPKLIDFFELESQDRRGKDTIGSPNTSLTTPFFKFL